MEISKFLKQGRKIWGKKKMSLSEIIVAIGVIYGDICRWQRNAKKDKRFHNRKKLEKELGNLIFSMIRWCDDVGFKPDECIREAIKAQKRFRK